MAIQNGSNCKPLGSERYTNKIELYYNVLKIRRQLYITRISTYNILTLTIKKVLNKK